MKFIVLALLIQCVLRLSVEPLSTSLAYTVLGAIFAMLSFYFGGGGARASLLSWFEIHKFSAIAVFSGVLCSIILTAYFNYPILLIAANAVIAFFFYHGSLSVVVAIYARLRKLVG